MSQPLPVEVAAASAQQKNSQKNYKYESVDDEKLIGAQVIKLDFNEPFPGEHLLFFCVEGVKNAKGSELCDHIQVHMTGIMDKNDIKKYNMHILGDGKGLVLKIPKILGYVRKRFHVLCYHNNCEPTLTKMEEIFAKTKKRTRKFSLGSFNVP